MELSEFFKENTKAAIALSGGADSAYLLWAAKNAGADVKAYYVKTAFQPEFEFEDAKRIASELGVEMRVINADVLSDERIASNPSDRCYFCKRLIFSKIVDAAREDDYTLLLDGTNASDEEGERPGFRALRELEVRSPLRECGLTKAKIRRLSREAELFTWDKPAYACLATRIPAGEEITAEKLKITEKAEDFLRELGFSDFRVRLFHGAARLQFREEQLARAVEMRAEIKSELGKYYPAVLMDMEARR